MALNPVRFAHQVCEQFRNYQLTAFPLTDPDLAGQAKELLGAGGFDRSPLVQGPYLSVARAFALGEPLGELAERGAVHPALPGIAEHPVLFAHQQETLEAVQAGEHVLVATGTGSGKTESFLYPIIDHCLWLRDDPAAPDGVVAVLVYPMNALAADQRDRLRSLLAGTGVTYGLYVGSTPRTLAEAQVMPLAAGSDRGEYERQARRRAAEGVTVVPYEECVSEQEIAERRPRLLLTNANQLEVLLTRAKDLGLFTGAPLRFLVLDEAHTYAGAGGAEVACLMRRLRAFCDKGTDEVTCIATSATLAEPEHAEAVTAPFLARLFGIPVDRARLVQETYDDFKWPGQRVMRINPAFPGDQGVLDAVLEALGTGEDDVNEVALADAVERLTGLRPQPGRPLAEALYDQLAVNLMVRALAEELQSPQHLDEAVERAWARLERTIPGEQPPGAREELLAYLALGAFAEREGAPLLRPKMHLFVRGLEGAVVAFSGPAGNPGKPAHARLYFSAEDAGREDSTRQPSAVFPVSVCKTCGQHYLTAHLHDFKANGKQPGGGEVTEDGTVIWRPRPAGTDDEGLVRFTTRFLAEVAEEEDSPDGAGADAARQLDRRRYPLRLCRYCGTFHHRDASGDCAAPHCRRPGPLVEVQVIVPGRKGFICPGCGSSPHQLFGRPVEPIRPLRGVAVADVHILAQEMVSAPASDTERRLLVFADNRQDAAFQAGWMRDHARRYRLRHLLLDAVPRDKEPISVTDIRDRLSAPLRRDRDLARLLAPEAFTSEADEAFGGEQRGRVDRFLRIQVLRELGASMTQTEGLERWGQVRVEYYGLTEHDPEVRALAESFGLAPEAVRDGLASLLDVWRRSGLLHDADEPIFGRWWRDGDEDIQRGLLPAGFADRAPQGLTLARSGVADQYLRQVASEHGRTFPMDFVAKWDPRWSVEDVREALSAIWDLFVGKRLLRSVTLVGGDGKPLRGSAGAFQVDAAQLGLVRQDIRFRCGTCQRVHARRTPGMVCTKRFCRGQLRAERPPAENYNVGLLRRPFSMVTAEEHTAQVPAAERHRIERDFKSLDGRTNTLVATPTLELGVDIGALDLVLLRNVPPTQANYWQRVGRAGRRRRMAVIMTYCRRTMHDGHFFEDPRRLLGAPVRPPAFNLRNDVLVAKHVRATVLSELLRLRLDGRLTTPEEAAVDAAFPDYIRDYLFEGGPDGRRGYRELPAQVTGIGEVVAAHRERLLAAVRGVFAHGWPADASNEVDPERLARHVDELHVELQRAVDRLHERLLWAVRTLRQLNEVSNVRQLDGEEQRQRFRCLDLIQRLGDTRVETYTLSVLAIEGLLPGYGMYEAGILAFPDRSGRLAFELSRPPAVALREFIPGNMLYANRRRFRTYRYHLPIDRVATRAEAFRVELDGERSGRVRHAGEATAGYATSGGANLEGLPICDVDLTSSGFIRDEELERFQLPVVVLGIEETGRRGGATYASGSRLVHHLLGQRLRLVNVGSAERLRKGEEPGYPVCTVCGAARSPYSSQRELDVFADKHQEACGRRPGRVGFWVDVTADTLHVPGLASEEDAVNLGEALRVGASRVLEMQPEDLQTLVIPEQEGSAFGLYLYDPMPGGSGLLDQLLERWQEIVLGLLHLLPHCPGRCERSCYECLRTGRNVFYHRLLDRAVAERVIVDLEAQPVRQYALEPEAPRASVRFPGGTNDAEDRLARMLGRARLGGFVAQHRIELGPPYKATIVDFAYLDERVAVYLDGLSKHLHGSPERARADQIISGQLEDDDWTVVRISASALDDPQMLLVAFKRIARAIGRRDLAKELDTDRSWLTEPDEVVPRDEAIALISDPRARALAQAVTADGLPEPAVGYELSTPEGWQVELAWPAARIAVLLDGNPDRDRWLAEQGWEARPVDGWPSEELIAMVRRRR